MEKLEKFINYISEPKRLMRVICIGMLIVITVQIGIYNGRKLEREKIKQECILE